MISLTTNPTTAQTTATGSSSSTSAATAGASTSALSGTNLGQQDFLKLMLAQLQNQDPLQPMENGEFLAQLAQFSTVGGIEQVNSTLTNFTDSMADFRMATASNLLGHQVLVPGDLARADAEGAVHGVVDLPDAATSVVVSYTDATSGQLLHTDTLGAQQAGLMGFSWDGVPQDMVDARSPVRVSVQATTASGTSEIGPSVFAKVLSARTGTGSSDMTLQVEDYGALNALEIEAFR